MKPASLHRGKLILEITQVGTGHPTRTNYPIIGHKLAEHAFYDFEPLELRVVLWTALGEYPKPPAVKTIVPAIGAEIELDLTLV